jgi:enterochelin esterase-like enzyme
MKTAFFSFCILALTTIQVFAQPLPMASTGTIRRIENFQSQFVDARNVDVWLPEGYSAEKNYPVLYMHDGQMLYDASTTWNKTAWDVDDVLARLIQEKAIQEVIVVGVWNGGKTRHSDYFPQKPFESLSAAQKETVYTAARSNGVSVFNEQKINSDNYLKFLVTELKPYIDKNFATKTDRKNTFIAGSSMGGLISMYAICEYPEVFGGAACLSTHWPGPLTVEGNPIPDAFLAYLQANLPNPKSHKIYFDYGDQTLDALYPPLQKKVDEVMKAKGYTKKSWLTRYFPGEDHSEKAWNKRLDIPLLFLLKK